eukprot:5042252-Prorocentrum_lima.AAC.1
MVVENAKQNLGTHRRRSKKNTTKILEEDPLKFVQQFLASEKGLLVVSQLLKTHEDTKQIFSEYLKSYMEQLMDVEDVEDTT